MISRHMSCDFMEERHNPDRVPRSHGAAGRRWEHVGMPEIKKGMHTGTRSDDALGFGQNSMVE